MPQAVYSQQFILYGAETPNTSYAVPSGFTAVIRQVTLYQEVGAYDFDVYIANSEEAPALVIYRAEGVAALAWVGQELRVVVPEEGIISIAASEIGTTPSFYVGGYLLRNSYGPGP